MQSPDSYGVRVNQKISDQVSVGASKAKVMLVDEDGVSSNNDFTSAWLSTSHLINGNTLKTSSIWAQTRDSNSQSLNSFLEEVVYQLGKNKFFGRVEVLQIAPNQLNIVVTDGKTGAQWVKAYTAGYERTLVASKNYKIFAGGSYTKNTVPVEFQPNYGTSPNGLKVFLRMNWAINN